MTNHPSSSYINVDALMPQVSLEQAAAFYGVLLPELQRIGKEIRTRCFLNCGRSEESSNRALAIDTTSPVTQFCCHEYDCTIRGNLISLCDLMKPGPHMQGRPRGQRFKDIAADLEAMVGKVGGSAIGESKPLSSSNLDENRRRENVPLTQALVQLDQHFLVDPAHMPEDAASYFLARPYLTPDVCHRWRMGYFPQTSDGGTLRGRIVYPMLDRDGQILSWFGRDPSFSEKQTAWVEGGRVGRAPEKFHFIAGFHRGLCLFGEHILATERERVSQQLHRMGIICVEGPNDVIALAELGVPAVAVCSNTITVDQAKKLAHYAHTLTGGIVTLMFDCDAAGESGTRQALALLAEDCAVRLAWSASMHDGVFAGRQPESLAKGEWEAIQKALVGDVALRDNAMNGEDSTP